MSKRMIDIYTPAQKGVKDYGLGEITDVTINGQAVIPILADKIYKSPYSAIRELYVNEVTAVKKALRINPKLKPEIFITANTNTRELIIKGVDSLGIDTLTFKKILAVMGNSGNNDGNETGYYGLGFYSFVKISERIIINSYSLESGEKWACIAKSALKFEKLPENSYKQLDKTGFEIKLTVKNDLDFEDITNRVKEISKLSGVKTYYTIDKVPIHLEQYDNLEHYFKSNYSKYFENKAHYSLMYEHIDNDDYELIIGHKAGNCETLRESFLINVPIGLEFSHNIPPICLLNVKNERIYKPSADRERFAEKDEENLLSEIESNIFEYHDKLKEIKNLDEWYKSKHRYFYDRIGKMSLLSLVKNGIEKDSYYNSIKKLELKDVLPAEKPIEFRISNTLRTKAFKKYEEQNIFAIQLVDNFNYDNFINAGFVDIDHGKKRSNRAYNNNGLTKRFKFHNKRASFEVLPEDALAVIKVDNVRTTHLKYSIHTNKIFWIPQKADYDNDIEIEDLETLLNPDLIYATNKGFLTAKQILKLAERFTVCENNNRTSDYDDNERFMKHLYNYHSHNLIIRFMTNKENLTQGKLLETILSLNSEHSYIGNDSIDFYQINKEKEAKKHEEWKTTITDTRLKSLEKEIDCSYHEDFKKIIESIQRSLDKN